MHVETVTDRIPVDQLGRTLMHEHLFLALPGAEFDPLATFDRTAFVDEAVRRLVQLREEFDVHSFVDPCPIELGRDAAMMREISDRSGVHVVCTTGFYFEQLGLPTYWRFRSVDEIAELYIREIVRGIGDTGVKAGAIKVATGTPVVSEVEKKFLAAACIAQRATGVPIITHTENGTCGPEQQKLFADGGVEAHRCLIGHCCGNADPVYHRRVVDGGSYIGFDRIGLLRFQSDETRADNLSLLLRSGHQAQIMMSQDRFCGWLGKSAVHVTREEQQRRDALRSSGGYPPPYTYLFTDFLPMLQARGVTIDQFADILEENPRRFFAGEMLPIRLGHKTEGTG